MGGTGHEGAVASGRAPKGGLDNSGCFCWIEGGTVQEADASLKISRASREETLLRGGEVGSLHVTLPRRPPSGGDTVR